MSNDEVEYPSNTNKEKIKFEEEIDISVSEDSNIKKVIKGEAIIREKTIGTRAKELIFGQDAKTTGNHVMFDVVVPAIKTMFYDAVMEGISRRLWGDENKNRPRNSGGSYRGGPNPGYSYTNYNKINVSKPQPNQSYRQISKEGRAHHDFQEIVIPTRGDAQSILDSLYRLQEEFGMVSVSDLYDLAGVDNSNFQDNKWGWENLAGANIRPVRGGYIINLPRTHPL